MNRNILLIAALFIVAAANSQTYKPGSKIIVKDKKIHELIPADAKIEILADGHQWTEGPLWLPTLNKLIYSDIPNNAIYEWSDERGKNLYLKPAGFTGHVPRSGEGGANGLLLDEDGSLILCQHGDRRIAKMDSPLSDPKADFVTITDSYNGKRLNSPNDAAYHKNGDLYFTDPPYGLEKGENDPAKEIGFQGVYKVDKNGKTVLLSKDFTRPNGIAFSPDYKKLYVANSDPKKAYWKIYDVDKDGMLKNGKIFYDVTDKVGKMKGLPDGMKVHPNGWVFATGPGGVLVFTSEGKHLGTLFTGEATANCAFNEDLSVLYMTADDYLTRIKMK